MSAGLVMTAAKRSRVRLLIVTMLFIATTIGQPPLKWSALWYGF